MAKKVNKAELAKKYAAALFEEAVADNAVDATAGEMDELASLSREDVAFGDFIRSRLISAKQKTDAVGAIADKLNLSGLVKRFLGVMAENGRLDILPPVCSDFSRRYDSYKGILSVEVVSSRHLDYDETNRLTGVLKNIFSKEIRLEQKVNPDLIGGLTVRIGSVMVDASVKSKLQKLNLVMKGVGV